MEIYSSTETGKAYEIIFGIKNRADGVRMKVDTKPTTSYSMMAALTYIRRPIMLVRDPATCLVIQCPVPVLCPPSDHSPVVQRRRSPPPVAVGYRPDHASRLRQGGVSRILQQPSPEAATHYSCP